MKRLESRKEKNAKLGGRSRAKKARKKTTKQTKNGGAGICRESSGPLSDRMSAVALERVYPGPA